MEIKDIDINKINIIENIRQKELKEDLAELMHSIKYSGLMQPIGVKETKNEYTLIWGYRRLCAFKNLGYNIIPAIIFSRKSEVMTEEDFLIANASENIHRKDVSPIELGRIISHLKKTMSVSEISEKLGIPLGRINDVLKNLANIPEKYRTKVKFFDKTETNKAGKIPFKIAVTIANFRNLTGKQKEEILDWISQNDIGQQQVNGLKAFLENGHSVKEAISLCGNYHSTSVKFLFNKVMLKKISEKEKINASALVKTAVREKYGKDFIL
ncbi:MAG TPA: ParB/RepB/Spo0J family partition protein [Candidatus Paceibacterota bacterium]|nr:ParB/RepB/Spo0J family partition protein [Candidatus Paceibacterota bacterium]